mmetsp:Transcript_1958/g.4590  ORF Transcript_1958/g.4590 Transcript_1958/m.4590 type:complete len:226 (+) Transcript_1958:1119-1796(+)
MKDFSDTKGQIDTSFIFPFCRETFVETRQNQMRYFIDFFIELLVINSGEKVYKCTICCDFIKRDIAWWKIGKPLLKLPRLAIFKIQVCDEWNKRQSLQGMWHPSYIDLFEDSRKHSEGDFYFIFGVGLAIQPIPTYFMIILYVIHDSEPSWRPTGSCKPKRLKYFNFFFVSWAKVSWTKEQQGCYRAFYLLEERLWIACQFARTARHADFLSNFDGECRLHRDDL